MRCIIWGTGKYYKDYITYFKKKDIALVVDRDTEKQGIILDEREICPPEHIKEEEYDYIFILVKNYQEIKKWLEENEVSKEKIKTYEDIFHVFNLDISLALSNDSVEKWFGRHEEKKIILFTPYLNRSGAPIATFSLAKLLRKMGYQVVIAGDERGALEEEIAAEHIEYFYHVSLWQKEDKIKECVKRFDYTIVSCTIMAELVKHICDMQCPIIWWLHESDDTLYKGYDLIEKDNIFYYGGGQRVCKKFQEQYPGREIKLLLYCLPEIEYKMKKFHKVKNIAMIGTISERKAQDVFIKAINKLEKDVREKANFYIVGPVGEKQKNQLTDLCQAGTKIIFKGELSQKELRKFYEELDILVCPSRDDPMPIVVTQALQYQISCIVSNQVGQSEFIKKYECGSVFDNENVLELAEKMDSYIKKTGEDLTQNAENGKKIYQEYFSENIMEENIGDILKNIENLSKD